MCKDNERRAKNKLKKRLKELLSQHAKILSMKSCML